MTLRPTTGTLVSGSERAEKFIRIFGGTTIPLKSPVAVAGRLPDGTAAAFYLLDFARVTPEQMDRLVRQLADDFGDSVDAVRGGLEEQGFLPLLAKDISVAFDARLVS